MKLYDIFKVGPVGHPIPRPQIMQTYLNALDLLLVDEDVEGGAVEAGGVAGLALRLDTRPVGAAQCTRT